MRHVITYFLFFYIITFTISNVLTTSYSDGSPKKICYFTNWAIYRNGSAKFTVEDIDFSVCNFIVYSFTSIDNTTFKIKLTDTFSDLPDGGGYDQIAKVVSKATAAGTIPIVSIAGWTDSANPAYPILFRNETLQDTFTVSVVDFCLKYGFKGFDWDFEYPQCPQGVCNPGTAEKEGFSNLIKKMAKEFKKHNFYLGAAVSGSVDKIDTYYQPSILNENLHWIGLMTYEYSSSTDKIIGLIAPFSKVKDTVEAWISHNVSPAKLIVGVPLYGVSYKLADKSKFIIGSPANGVGFLNRPLYYNEICDLIKNQNWAVTAVENEGTFAHKDDQWVGFDDVKDCKEKAKYIREKKLAGYMVWAIDQDDFRGNCGKGKYPLLTALSNTLDGK